MKDYDYLNCIVQKIKEAYYLVTPVLELGARERSVYLPKGKWESISDNKIYDAVRQLPFPLLLMLCLYLKDLFNSLLTDKILFF